MPLGGKKDEAIKVLEKAASCNNLPTKNIRNDVTEYLAHKGDIDEVENRKGNILDLLRTPIMRMYTIAICFNWLVCGLCFFGVSQFIGHLGGKRFGHINNQIIKLLYFRKHIFKRRLVGSNPTAKYHLRVLVHQSMGKEKDVDICQCFSRSIAVLNWFCSFQSDVD